MKTQVAGVDERHASKFFYQMRLEANLILHCGKHMPTNLWHKHPKIPKGPLKPSLSLMLCAKKVQPLESSIFLMLGMDQNCLLIMIIQRLGDNGHYNVLSQQLSQSSASQGAFGDRSFSYINDVKTIGNINSLQHCPAYKRTNKSTGVPFICTYCENKFAPITKYKIEIEVEYEGKISCFVFWDKYCIQYVGLSAHDLREVMKKTNEDHPQIYPAHLDNLLGKEFSFRVKYQLDFKQSSIVKLTEDKQIIQIIKDAMVQHEMVNSPIIKATEIDSNLDLPDKDSVTPTRVPISNMFASQNSSDDVNSCKTPCKRLSQESDFEELGSLTTLSLKLSATKSAKSGKHAKRK
ncbi:unnamed protein product [Lathyrus oleraceus]